MDKVSILHSDYEKREQLIILHSWKEDSDGKEVESIRFSKEQMKEYIKSFVGREDTYAVQELDKNGRQHYVQMMYPEGYCSKLNGNRMN